MEHIPWLTVLFAYLLGSLSPGWFFVWLKTKRDVRAQGSGATGATNTARVLGANGFVLVLLCDMAKGALAAGLPRLAAAGGLAREDLALGAACILAVVAGHIWPLFLRFRGGKGIGCFLGAWLVLAPLSLAAPFVAGLVFWGMLRKGPMIGALLGLAAQPPLLWKLTHDRHTLLFASLTIAAVLWAHRPNIQKAFASPTAQKNP
ncbi:MAG: glycerol-3-phosphate acyltransferase [Opitutaceae bacterium]|jgi:glycerol-3-phosphate acyltransferase PlsY|nr:glycerol-3-phosphate acyltransferase [Opitutaceae bacterium]